MDDRSCLDWRGWNTLKASIPTAITCSSSAKPSLNSFPRSLEAFGQDASRSGVFGPHTGHRRGPEGASFDKGSSRPARNPLSSIVTLESRDSEPGGCLDTAHLIETQSPSFLGNELEWRTISELLKTPALWDVQRDFLVEYASISASLSLPSSPRFIGYHGWTADLQDWAGAAAMRAGLGAIKDFMPFRASRVEAVVAFQTVVDRSIYVKCCAPMPFTEALVTRALGGRYPESVAKTLDFCAERGWWAAEEVSGPSLAERLTLKDCLDAIGPFTRMQKELIGCHAIFSEMGLRDLRLAEIDRQIDATLAEIEEVSALSSNELSGLSSLLSKATADLAELDFPDSLIHGDLTPSNIKLSRQGPVFLDWEDAAWGPAIVSVEIFLAALRVPQQAAP